MARVGNQKAEYRGYSLTQKRSKIRGKIKAGKSVKQEEVDLLPPMERKWIEKGGGLSGGGLEAWKSKYLTPEQRKEQGHPVDRTASIQAMPKFAENARESLLAMKEALRPAAERYFEEIRQDPDLTTRESGVARWLSIAMNATTKHEFMEANKHLDKILGLNEIKVTVTDTRSESQVMSDLASRVTRLLGAGEVVDADD